MRAFVDKDLCISCLYCNSVCPEVFSTDAEGKSEPVADELSLVLEECAKKAKVNCPLTFILNCFSSAVRFLP